MIHGALTGESTPFMYSMHVPRLIHRVMPKVKLIFLLRDPVQRAFSHYKMNLRREGVEPLDFSRAIRAEDDRIAEDLVRVLSDANYNDENNRKYSYVHRGLYEKQIQRWLEYFPMEQIYIAESECLFENPQDILNDITDFLNLHRHQFNFSKKRNVSTHILKCNRSDLDYLEKIYTHENELLFELIGRRYWGK